MGLWYLSQEILKLSSYGHTMLATPDPVRSPKLNHIWTSQYYGVETLGNTGYCSVIICVAFGLFLVC